MIADMPNQRELARQLGLSQSTVSLALRGSSLIAAATRQRVQTEAARLGYSPNPLVASLMEHIRSAKPVRDAGCIALLVDFPNQEEWLNFHLAYRQQYEAICRRAEQRGYRTECFYLQARGMSPAVIDRILHSRGIVGVLLAGPRTECESLEMKWDRYAWIKSGFTWEEPRMDCVSADNRQHVELAFRELGKRGNRRIGYCLSRRMVPRANSNWVAGYLIAQRRLPAARRLPLFVTDPTAAGWARFRRWLKRWKPDVVIGGAMEWEWLQKIQTGAPRFCWRSHFPGTRQPAIEENNAIIGETLCDLLIEKIIHNERGLPGHPRHISIEGSWCEADAG